MDDREAQATMPPARAQMLRLVRAAPVVQAIHVATKLGIADLLADGPKSAEELARAAGAHAPSLYRLLRFLANMDIFAEDGERRFSLTPLAEMLRSDVHGSVRQAALLNGETWYWRQLECLLHNVTTGEPAFEHAHGVQFFDYLARDPRARALFDEIMTESSAPQIPAILDAYDFSKFRQIVDVGAGRGRLLAAILARHPTLRGVLYDTPETTSATPALGAAGVAERCEVIQGNFFESVPAGGDAYLLKWILHDWSDQDAVRILRNCRRATDGQATLLVAEMVVPDHGPHDSKAADLIMMTMLRGRERTEAEFRELFRAADFEMVRLVPTTSPLTIIEGRPTR